MFDLIMLAAPVVMLLFMAGEVFYERDWPRSTFKYFAVTTVCCVGYFLSLR